MLNNDGAVYWIFSSRFPLRVVCLIGLHVFDLFQNYKLTFGSIKGTCYFNQGILPVLRPVFLPIGIL